MGMIYNNPKPVRGYRDLIAWQRAVELARHCDSLSERFWRSRRRAIAEQLLKAGVSVPMNIAEGHGRLSHADNVRHLTIALGSLREVDTVFEIFTETLAGPDLDNATVCVDEVGRLLMGLIRKHGTRRL